MFLQYLVKIFCYQILHSLNFLSKFLSTLYHLNRLSAFSHLCQNIFSLYLFIHIENDVPYQLEHGPEQKSIKLEEKADETMHEQHQNNELKGSGGTRW